MNTQPWIVLVGGFLGAGKTTLLLAAARELDRRGLRSAIILNDQGEALVDTELAALHHLQRGEVTGGCFCCRFSDLLEVIGRLRQHAPDVIFAEPVGSCTDISATTLHPLLAEGEVRVAPYTVLVDPERASALLRDDADPNLAFLFRRQIEEADLVCFTKSDLRHELPARPAARQISATTGQGVAAWLDEVLSGELSSGRTLLDIDYEQYARAEAALAWLNAEATLHCSPPLSPPIILGPLFEQLDADLTAAGITIVHLKAILHAETGYVKAAICANGQPPTVEGNLDASPASRHQLLINLRAAGPAATVRGVIERDLIALPGEVANLRVACFHPAPPRPERRVTPLSAIAHPPAASPRAAEPPPRRSSTGS
ncbi:MAG TPA: GTP-binding protein [Acidobacteriaceae bacterium]|nr:GTP-binding protein [Acidobacteriaceae bacterium]